MHPVFKAGWFQISGALEHFRKLGCDSLADNNQPQGANSLFGDCAMPRERHRIVGTPRESQRLARIATHRAPVGNKVIIFERRRSLTPENGFMGIMDVDVQVVGTPGPVDFSSATVFDRKLDFRVKNASNSHMFGVLPAECEEKLAGHLQRVYAVLP
ncbi:hypothetical protein PAXINDRAFT_6787 [Paxillus involutus ATCC 200175]|nr:hypothetical protein PAXINDRAFT_6787 [Paxillus involutus ATCC 200175]